MLALYAWMAFVSITISLVSIGASAVVIVRSRRHRCPTPTVAGVTFRAPDKSVVAVLQPDGSIEVHQPDMIRAAGDALAEELAGIAARQVAAKQFGDMP
jgi:hypothetical protein